MITVKSKSRIEIHKPKVGTDSGDSTPSENRQVGQAAGIIGFYTLLSRILGLVRDMVVAYFFGSKAAADAFFVAFRIPNLLRRLFAEGSLSIAFIPVFTEYLQKKSREDAMDLARVVFTLLSVILAVVTLAGILGAPWIVRIQAIGFDPEGVRYELTVLLTRITFPYIFLISLVALFMGILNSLRHFAAPAAAPIFLNVGIIGAALWSSSRLSEPVVGLAVGVLNRRGPSGRAPAPLALPEGGLPRTQMEPRAPGGQADRPPHGPGRIRLGRVPVQPVRGDPSGLVPSPGQRFLALLTRTASSSSPWGSLPSP